MGEVIMNSWFNERRYGLFIHWGPYSVAGRGEWIKNRELIPDDEYTELYVKNFRAEKFDPDKWMEYARKWGFGYAVLTSRHHDGFALWDSKVNPYNSVQLGPKRDIVAEYLSAVRKAGLKAGLYYSPANWSHPDYPGYHFRDWPGEGDWKSEECRQRFIEYYRAELKELLTNYGKIDYLWFDGCIPENIDGEETIKMIRLLQPEILINNRLGVPYDVKVCEQTVNPPKEQTLWEACMTLNQNWGYHAGDHRWKTPEDVIHLLLQCAQDGGNLLLNIAPESDGTIPAESIKILDEAGKWLSGSREAVENTERHGFSWNCTGRPITVKKGKIYLHFILDPGETFCWGELASPVNCAYWLDSGETVKFEQRGERLFLHGLKHHPPCRTLVLEVRGEMKANFKQTTFWIPE